MPIQEPNGGKLKGPEASLVVKSSPAPPALVVPGGWGIEGLPRAHPRGRP